MITKIKEKKRAIALRKQGFSYSEILEHVPVTKSTLSEWLRHIVLTEKQKERLADKMSVSSKLGAQAKREKRIRITEEIKRKARREIKKISKRELWLMGIMLYWAEGAKEKEWRPGSQTEFGNSDPRMIKLYLKWLIDVLAISRERLVFKIYIHENHKHRLTEVKKFWSEVTGFDISKLQQVHFKKHKIKTNRKNITNKYHGLLVIRVRASSSLTREIAGWVEGVDQCSGIV